MPVCLSDTGTRVPDFEEPATWSYLPPWPCLPSACLLRRPHGRSTPCTSAEFCQEPQHRQSRFCDGRGISADDPRREAFRWYVLRERCRLSRAPDYCKDIEGVVPDCPVLVLTYDHSAGRWDPEGTKRQSRSSLDANGRPTVYAGSQDSVLVVITNSNPLIYGSSVGEVKEEEIAQIAVLQSLMTGLGSALQSWVTMAGQRSTEAPSSPLAGRRAPIAPLPMRSLPLSPSASAVSCS